MKESLTISEDTLEETPTIFREIASFEESLGKTALKKSIEEFLEKFLDESLEKSQRKTPRGFSDNISMGNAYKNVWSIHWEVHTRISQITPEGITEKNFWWNSWRNPWTTFKINLLGFFFWESPEKDPRKIPAKFWKKYMDNNAFYRDAWIILLKNYLLSCKNLLFIKKNPGKFW